MVSVGGPIMVRRVIAGILCLGHRHTGPIHGDMADCDWSTHAHHGSNSSKDSNSVELVSRWGRECFRVRKVVANLLHFSPLQCLTPLSAIN